MKWAGEAGSALTDLGAPVDIVGHLERGDTSKGTSDVSGYSLVDVDSPDAVLELLREHPHLYVPGNSIDVLEVIPMPGM